jgi:hypothetical protein
VPGQTAAIVSLAGRSGRSMANRKTRTRLIQTVPCQSFPIGINYATPTRGVRARCLAPCPYTEHAQT